MLHGVTKSGNVVYDRRRAAGICLQNGQPPTLANRGHRQNMGTPHKVALPRFGDPPPKANVRNQVKSSDGALQFRDISWRATTDQPKLRGRDFILEKSECPKE